MREACVEKEERVHGMKKRMKSGRKLSGSIFFKIIVFLLLAVSTLVGAVATAGTVCLCDWNVYECKYEEWLYECFEGQLQSDAIYLRNCVENEYLESVQEYCAKGNLDVTYTKHDKQKDVVVWSDYEGYNTPFVYVLEGQLAGEQLGWNYTLKLYLRPTFEERDAYQRIFNWARFFYDMQVAIPIAAVCGILTAILCFVFLMCGAGHKNGEEGIVPSALASIHLDVLTIIFGIVSVVGVVLIDQEVRYIREEIIALALLILIITLEVIWVTIYCVEVAGRLKRGKWWRNTLIYLVFSGCKKIFCFLGRGVCNLVRGIPMALDAILVFLGISILELIGLCMWGELELVACWILEKLILFPLLLYIVVQFKRLQKGSEALAEGNLNYQLDTKGMVLDFKEQADNLNCIGKGMSIAVEERMKSERLKTELITNVSHDIKTPLTSIINYADLLGHAVSGEGEAKEQADREQLAEYAEVLLRQSKRMKKLLDDLLEASKATTGNLEVTMTPCEISVLLSQALGEYEQRFAEKQLQLVIKQPEEPIRIMADGRHLWRVFDNLLNNIFKYAQENTRVYLNVECLGEKVEIIFRNMSKYALDVSGQELEERFARGDKSRHMEGSGLGLSIAKSLVELLQGEMEIVTDGDLFKVILRFALLSGEKLLDKVEKMD